MEQPHSALGAAERADLRLLHEQVRGSGNVEWVERVGPMFADQLRHRLPDLDDVTIGRVVLEVASYLKDDIAARPAAVDAVVPLWGTMTAAGLSLTRAEWDDERP